jgi:phosphoserine aminotransferase
LTVSQNSLSYSDPKSTGDPDGMKLIFVNNDWKELQEEVLVHCKDYKEMKNQTCFLEGDYTICSFFNQFEENEINWVKKSTEREALISVQNGESIGYLSFPKDFSQHLKERMLFRAFSDNETIDGSTITLRMDMTSNFIYILANKYINSKFQIQLAKCGC